MITLKDPLGFELTLTSAPERIICLVPSITELLFDLQLNRKIVGRTKYCVLPTDKVRDVPVVGGTKYVNLDAVKSLNPDLIICNKEENTKEIVSTLRDLYNVYVSDVTIFEDALQMIDDISRLCDVKQEGRILKDEISASMKSLKRPDKSLNACYLIWRKPYMVAGSDTFINSMLHLAGFSNCFDSLSRYPEVDFSDLKNANANHIFLSSEPYPFGEKHLMEFQRICPNAEISVVDGQIFSWYGSRLKYFSNYINELYQNLKI